MVKCVAIAIEHRGAMAAVFLGKGLEQRAGLCGVEQQLVGVVLATVIHDHEARGSPTVVGRNDWVPVIDARLDVLALVVRRDNDVEGVLGLAHQCPC